jgi:TnpA family transposase
MTGIRKEVSVHALHLLQSCLVYVNTLMLRRVLMEPTWPAWRRRTGVA